MDIANFAGNVEVLMPDETTVQANIEVSATRISIDVEFDDRRPYYPSLDFETMNAAFDLIKQGEHIRVIIEQVH